MEFSRHYLLSLSSKTNFIKDTLEKVLRLAEILKFINSDSVFKNKLALKGGTAINFTAVKLPRLSVDIDLDYTENIGKNDLDNVKILFRNRLISWMQNEGYFLINEREFFALSSIVFGYINNAGNRDNIKVEINYLDRCHILPLENKKVLLDDITEGFDVLTLNTNELYASKINALLSRALPRDLYDINTMINDNIVTNTDLLRKCIIFYSMIGGDYEIENVDYGRIEKLDFQKFKTQLKPVIAKTDEFNIEIAKKKTVDYLKSLLTLTDDEKQFIFKMRNKEYQPELLFSENTIVENIVNHPAALWRTMEKK